MVAGVIPFDCSEYRTVTKWNPGGLTIHLQIDLEDMDELKEDLVQGFVRLASNS